MGYKIITFELALLQSGHGFQFGTTVHKPSKHCNTFLPPYRVNTLRAATDRIAVLLTLPAMVYTYYMSAHA